MENFLKSFSAPALLLLAVAALSPAPAAAQPFVEGWAGTFHEDLDGGGPLLPVAQVRRILGREGVRMIGLPHVRDGEIIAMGRDNFGARKKVVLDAHTGEVLDVTLVSPPREGPEGAWPGDAPRERRGEYRGGEFDGTGRPLPPPAHSLGEAPPPEGGATPAATQGGPVPEFGVNPDQRPRSGEAQPNRLPRQPNDPAAARPAAPVAARPPAPAPAAPAQAAAPVAPRPASPPAPVQAQAAPAPTNPAPNAQGDRSMTPIRPLHPESAPSHPAQGAPKVEPLPN